MKRYLLLFLALVCGQAFGATAVIVQSSGKQAVTNSSTNPTYTITGVTNHDTLIVLVNYIDDSNNSSTPASVSDGGGTYTVDEQINANNQGSRWTSASAYSFFNAAAGSHTITFTRGAGATAAYWIYDVLEVSGLPTTNSKDASSTTNYGASGGPLNIGGSSLGAANGLALTLSVVQATSNPPAIYPPEIGMSGSGSSWNGLFTGSADYPSGAAGYLIPATTAALGADFGVLMTPTGWGVLAVYYTPATGGGSCTHAGYTAAGAIATPNGSSGSYVGKAGTVTPDCSTVYYWSPAAGNFVVN